MKMLTVVRRRRLLAVVGVFAVGVLLSGCPSATNREKAGGSPKKTETGPAAANRPAAEPEATPKAREMVPARRKVAKKEPPEEKLMQEVAEIAEKPRDLGPPLVDNPDNLKRLVPRQPIWIDLPDKQVVLQGEVCKAGYPLEFFATYSNRSYEAIVAVNVKPSIVHTGLLAVGAEAGHPGAVPAGVSSRPPARKWPSRSAGRTPRARCNRPPPSIGSATSRPGRSWTPTGCLPEVCS